jgi:phthiocerol/phenolphthiocerol synthesis type-I polyketide synthase E
MADPMPPQAIAIIGLSGRFPGADGIETFWRNIANGLECLNVPADADLDAAAVPQDVRANPRYVRKYTALDGDDCFDAAFFGISPREAQIMDPQHRVFLECAVEALEHAGYAKHDPDLSVGVYAGASMNSYLHQILRDPALVRNVGGYQLMLGNDKDFLCTRVSYKLDLHGPSMSIQTACSTSLVAVVTACRALARGECDVALAGGVSITVPGRSGYVHEEGMIFSPDGHCRPFDAQAKGTRGGAGAGIVVLKRLSDAIAGRDTIHAIIRGAAMNNDGAAKAGYTAPSVDGQIEVIATAQTLAGIKPREISYIEAHGTGTPLGDPIEIAALTAAFRASTDDVGFCRLGSLKANLGHLDAAAGVASLIKTILALQHRVIPPLVNFSTPNPELHLAKSPFVATVESSAWENEGAPRRAGVSSFGIGGTNAHVVVEEAPAAAPTVTNREHQLLVLSAKSSAALDDATSRLADYLDHHPTAALCDVAWTLQVGRSEFEHRRAVPAASLKQAIALLRDPHKAPVASSVHSGGQRPVAFLFSGQGSQSPGMGHELYLSEPVFRDAIDKCAAVLDRELGLDLRVLLFSEQASAISETRYAQPALFAVEYALACLWREWGVTPKAMLGHSIGEFVAAHLAGVFSLNDALSLVAARGRLMQACPPGAMAAVHLSEAELSGRLPEGLEVAAVNGPSLCAVAGPSAALENWLEGLTGRGVKSVKLKTSHAFHSATMEPACIAFAKVVARVSRSPPKIPYVSNLTGSWITPEQAMSPDYYAQHLRRAVQFSKGVKSLLLDPALMLLEVGPGTALTTVAKLNDAGERAQLILSSLPHVEERRSENGAVFQALGRLWSAGVPLDWRRLHGTELPRRIPLPTYPFQRQRYWVEATSSQRQGAITPAVDPTRWTYAPTWTRDVSPVSEKQDIVGTWLVMSEPGQLANSLVDSLQKAGARGILVEIGTAFEVLDERHFRVRLGHREDVATLIRAVSTGAGSVTGAIFLREPQGRAGSHQTSDYLLPVVLAEDLRAAAAKGVTLLVATFGAQSVLTEPVRDPAASLAIGPTLVLPAEVPKLTMRAVDFEAPFSAAQTGSVIQGLLFEAAAADHERIVAWRGGRRWRRRYEHVAIPAANPPKLPVKQGGVYLITGGLGGIGLALARWLAIRTNGRLILTARAQLPPRQDWDRLLVEGDTNSRIGQAVRQIREIESHGAEIVTAAADVANFDQMKEAIDQARLRWGEINGVIHAAGIAGNGRLAFLKSREDVEAVLAPKVDGLAVLVRLLGEKPLDFVALMSSINAVVGAPGTSDYTAANLYLDAFGESEARPKSWRKVIAFDWGAWRDVGMAAALAVPEARRPQWKEHLNRGISPDQGVDLFERGLSAEWGRIVVTPYDLSAPVSFTHELDTVVEETSSSKSTRSASASRTGSGSSTELVLSQIWSELLGNPKVGIDDDFFQLGGHSLLATRMMARIEDSFGISISLRDVFDAPTIEKLASRINSWKLGLAAAVDENQEDREELIF